MTRSKGPEGATGPAPSVRGSADGGSAVHRRPAGGGASAGGGLAAVLATDVGNSKTDLALIAADGHVLAAVRGPSASHQAVGMREAMRTLERLVESVAAAAGVDPNARPLAAIGAHCMAGADLPVDVRRLRRALAVGGLTGREIVENDTMAVLRAGAPEGWGVAVVSGAGINCSGRAPGGRVVRFAALGDISGDWGGGGSVGMAGLGAAVRGSDGRGPRTTLERLVPAHFGLATSDAVTRAIYLGRVAEARIREIAPVVFAAARAGDPVAGAIVDREADEVVAMAGAALRRLRLQRLSVPVVLAGGMFRDRDPRLLTRIAEGIAKVAPRAVVQPLDVLPVVGAGLLGLDLLEASPDAQGRLRRELNEQLITGTWTA